jgi:HEAT repeat protein
MSLDADELQQLREELHAPEPARRESAIRRLGAVVHAEAPAVLAEALTSESGPVRDQALALLEQMAGSGDASLEQIVAAVRGVGPGA